MMAEENSEKKNILSTRNLKKRYKKRTVVQDVSLEVGSGEVVGLLGPNGAGKTTTIKMLSTLILPTSGNIKINGLDIDLNKRFEFKKSFLNNYQKQLISKYINSH